MASAGFVYRVNKENAMNQDEIRKLREIALDVRIKTINEIASFGQGHIGGSMSVVELLVYLYFHEMRVRPQEPEWVERDRLVLSKGHSGPALYAVLASKGYFDESWLTTLNKGGTRLPSHADMTKTPGIDFTAGSLGQGFSAAVGIALAQRMRKLDSYTYVVVGDGESQEGEVWEAAEAAGAWKLGNLIGFTDLNGQQLDDYTDNIIPMHDLKKRYETYGWEALEIDGHDFSAIEAAIAKAKSIKDKPVMIIMHTIKSYGYIPGEGIRANHSMQIDKSKAEEAIAALIKREEARI